MHKSMSRSRISNSSVGKLEYSLVPKRESGSIQLVTLNDVIEIVDQETNIAERDLNSNQSNNSGNLTSMNGIKPGD